MKNIIFESQNMKKEIKNIIIGVDEAGRGPWMGPVTAVALCFNNSNFPENSFLEKLDDSKKLTEIKRIELFNQMIKMSQEKTPQIYFGLGMVDNFIIDNINIKQANKEAMRRAIIELLRKIDNKKIKEVLIDGRDNYKFEELEKEPIYIVGGDGKILEIGAASIIAKVFRDKIMNTYSSLYPNLGIESHKGYGTKKHSEKLKSLKDIIGIHRLSYKPIKIILDKKK